MASFLAGDTPVADFDYNRPAAVDIQDATVTVSVSGQTVAAHDDGNGIVGTWDALTLPEPGMYPIYLLVTADGRTESTLADYLVVCDPADEWHNVITARLEWDGAPESDGKLARLLDVAREQVEAYAPVSNDTPVPERYRAAQLMQARNTFNASLTNGDQQTDMGGFVMTIRPLDWAVKQLIRPLTATKAVG
jgi:hypothetical protein